MDGYKCPKCGTVGRENFDMVSGQLDDGRDIEYWRCLYCGKIGNAFSQIMEENQGSLEKMAREDDEELGF